MYTPRVRFATIDETRQSSEYVGSSSLSSSGSLSSKSNATSQSLPKQKSAKYAKQYVRPALLRERSRSVAPSKERCYNPLAVKKKGAKSKPKINNVVKILGSSKERKLLV